MDNINFCSLGSEDLEWARLLHNDPEVLSMLTDSQEVSEQQQKHWFLNLQKSKSSKRLIVFSGVAPIGVVRLDLIDYYNKSIRVGLDIHKDFRGQGFAKPIYYKVFKEWFVDRRFNRVWLMVVPYNTIAVNLYKKLGFKNEGVQRQALLKDGKFYDYLMMSILREDYNGRK